MDITDLRLDFVSTGVFHNYLSKAVKACNRKLQWVRVVSCYGIYVYMSIAVCNFLINFILYGGLSFKKR